MSNTLGYGLSLNTGTYFGGGYSNTNTGATSAYNNRVASSTNLNRVSRDIAQGYNQDMQIIALYMQQGNVQQALTLYDSLFDSIKDTADGYGYELSDGQITSILNQAYANATGSSFVSSINKETHSPFITGLIEGIPVVGWFLNGSSDAEAISKVAGTKTRFIDKAAEVAGGLVTGIAGGAAAGAAIGAIGGPIGAVGGAVVGGVASVLKCIFKGV